MIFLVELDHSKSGLTPTPEAGRTFIEQVISRRSHGPKNSLLRKDG